MSTSAALALAADIPELSTALAWFSAFSAPYCVSETGESCPALNNKLNHSLAVARNAVVIADSLDLTPQIRHAALLAALLHDVGRFPQFAQWHTFRDADSVSHGPLGARVVARHWRQALEHEDLATRRLVIGAVALHNRYTLPDKLHNTLATVTHIVRDADKVDILRVLSSELCKPEPSPDIILHVAREPKKWSPQIVDMLLCHQVPNYPDLRYVNDFIMLLCIWPSELTFAASRTMVWAEGTVESLLDCLPRDATLDPVRDLVRAQKMARGSSKR